jgi:hypothetical protein
MASRCRGVFGGDLLTFLFSLVTSGAADSLKQQFLFFFLAENHIPTVAFVALYTALTFCEASGVLASDFGGGAGALRRVRFGVRGDSSAGSGSTRTTMVSSTSSCSSSSNIVETLRFDLVVRGGVLTVFRLLRTKFRLPSEKKNTQLTDNAQRPLALPENHSRHF